MKKFLAVLMLVCMLLSLAACGTSPAEPETDETEETAETVAVPEEVFGSYHEEIAGRGSMTVDPSAESGADVYVNWPNSAFEYREWTFHAEYDAENGRLVYEDAVAVTITYESENDDPSRTVEYENGTGYLEIGEDVLVWFADDEALSSDGAVFRKNDYYEEEPGMPNPWQETEDLEEAIQGSGVEITLPPEEALPGDLRFWKYRYMDGVFEALYESVNDQLIIRKSMEYSAAEISGDYNEYAEEWDWNFKGVNAHCKGDEETANVVLIDSNIGSFCFLYNNTPGAPGLTEDEVRSLVMGIQ